MGSCVLCAFFTIDIFVLGRGHTPKGVGGGGDEICVISRWNAVPYKEDFGIPGHPSKSSGGFHPNPQPRRVITR